MQVCFDGLKGISFDLADHAKWEFVFLDNNKPRGIRASFDPDNAEAYVGSDDDEDNEESEVLDLPPSWVEKLTITKEQFESKCPSGSKILCYKNVKCEVFAEYFRPDGIILRITDILDDPGKITEYFENRKDKLRERRRLKNDTLIYEYFLPGRLHGLREHIIENGKTKEMHFYPSARSDGLCHRIATENKIIENYVDREDKLYYRSVKFEPFEPKNDKLDPGMTEHIVKVTDKFGPQNQIKRNDPYKKTYYIKDERVNNNILKKDKSSLSMPSWLTYTFI